MSDDPSKRGRPHRTRVSQQKHELRHLIRSTGQPASTVKQAVRRAGPSRKTVTAVLRQPTKR